MKTKNRFIRSGEYHPGGEYGAQREREAADKKSYDSIPDDLKAIFAKQAKRKEIQGAIDLQYHHKINASVEYDAAKLTALYAELDGLK